VSDRNGHDRGIEWGVKMGGARVVLRGRFNDSRWSERSAEGDGRAYCDTGANTDYRKKKQETLFRRFISRSVSLGLIFPLSLPLGKPQPVLLGSTQKIPKISPRFMRCGADLSSVDSWYRVNGERGEWRLQSKVIPGAKENENESPLSAPLSRSNS